MSEKPELAEVDPKIRQYIEYLENEVESLHQQMQSSAHPSVDREQEPAEPPTTIQVISFTASGVAKRTYRHYYTKQRRGGMGVFDMDTPANDPPNILVLADENQHLLLFTNLGRVFRFPVGIIEPTEVRARGASLAGKIQFLPDEHLSAVLPDQARGAVAFVTQRGYVRTFRHHIFGEYMKPGTSLIDPQKFGEVVTASWTTGTQDLFISTRQGKAIRFAEKLVPPQGTPGIRLETGDYPVAITAVEDESRVFMVDAQGNGTLRLMAGFSANKSAGGGGKIAMKTQSLVTSFSCDLTGDIFLISNLSKVIRFALDEVPVKEDPVQGVRCMDLRADFVAAGTQT